MTRQPGRSAGRPTLDAVAARAGVGRGTASGFSTDRPGQPAGAGGRRGRDRGAGLRAQPGRAVAGHPAHRLGRPGRLRVAGTGVRRPFFAGVLRSINAALIETPLQLWLAMAATPEHRQRVEHHLTNQHVDGVLLLSLHDDDPLPGLLRDRGMPFVLGGRPARTRTR